MSNGCGCENGLWSWFKPPYAEFFRVACELHDNDYDTGGSAADRKAADAMLLSRCLELVAVSGYSAWGKWLRCMVSFAYYIAVRMNGYKYYNKKEKGDNGSEQEG